MKLISASYLSIFTLFLSFQLSSAQGGLAECPTTQTISVGSSGAKYALCQNSDFQGPSAQVIKNTANLAACAQLCDDRSACLRAVYDHVDKVCHIKTNKVAQLTWATSTKFDVIRLQNDVAELENIAQCPFTVSKYTTNSKSFTLCRGTDFQGATASVTKGVTTANDCAQLCSSRTGCSKAVWDGINNLCHIKAPMESNTLIRVMNKQYTIIELDVPLNAATLGSWSNLIRLPVIPVAGYVVPEYPDSSRMLFWSSWGVDAFGGASGKTQFADYNFKTGAVSERQVANTAHDMFCPGISSLEDGRLMVSGGSDAAAVSSYTPTSNTFTKDAVMKIPRGYQSSATTSEGKVFEVGGSYSGARGGKTGELYDPATNTWTILKNAITDPMLTVDAEGIWRTDNHAWLYSWSNGSVFQAGPSKAQNWYSTLGAGSVKASGIRDTIADAMCGINVMYAPGKILSAGGSQSYTNSPANARSHITTITVPNVPATVERVPDMAYPRGFANAVALPDGKVLVTGGQKKSLVFTDTDGILFPELFDPVKKTWTQMNPHAVPRNYHSTSLLLPDGTVWSGGGGLCYVNKVGGSTANCNKAVDHADGQIFSPPYLFNADGTAATRPVLSALSSQQVKVGGTLSVTITGGGKASLVMVRMGSSTHSINTDQRRVPLDKVSTKGDVYTATLNGDSGVLIPGFWYLFAVSDKGVPSIAKTIRITRS